MSRIFITGDCHRSYVKLGFKSFPEARELTKEDYVIVCGDFGYWDNSQEQEFWMDWLDMRPFTTLWVDGNHENYDMLSVLDVKEWHGGKVHFIRPSVIHLLRGQLFDIAGKRVFAFGGARSHDIADGILEPDDPMLKAKAYKLDLLGGQYRINHLSWWKEEMPSDEERETGRQTLARANWEVDYIISHCCATTTLQERTNGRFEPDEQTDYFAEIQKKISFEHWFFGHYHINEDWSNKETCLYGRIVELTEDGYESRGLANHFKHGERVRFTTRGRADDEQYEGTILHISELGGGLHAGEQPTANIRTDEGHIHKNIPFEAIQKTGK